MAGRVHDLHAVGDFPRTGPLKLPLYASHVNVGPLVLGADVDLVHDPLHVGEAFLPAVHVAHVILVTQHHVLHAAHRVERLGQVRGEARAVHEDVEWLALRRLGRDEVRDCAEALLRGIAEVENLRDSLRVYCQGEAVPDSLDHFLRLARADAAGGARDHGLQGLRGLLLGRRLRVHDALAARADPTEGLRSHPAARVAVDASVVDEEVAVHIP
eukprot:scaffold774_cov248-Pinguiococcus_pyrenoidosus.AAC.23